MDQNLFFLEIWMELLVPSITFCDYSVTRATSCYRVQWCMKAAPFTCHHSGCFDPRVWFRTVLLADAFANAAWTVKAYRGLTAVTHFCWDLSDWGCDTLAEYCESVQQIADSLNSEGSWKSNTGLTSYFLFVWVNQSLKLILYKSSHQKTD